MASLDQLDQHVFRCKCSSLFQGTAASIVYLTAAQGQLYRSPKVSLTLFQTDMRITNRRGHKFSQSPRSFMFKTPVEWPPD